MPTFWPHIISELDGVANVDGSYIVIRKSQSLLKVATRIRTCITARNNHPVFDFYARQITTPPHRALPSFSLLLWDFHTSIWQKKISCIQGVTDGQFVSFCSKNQNPGQSCRPTIDLTMVLKQKSNKDFKKVVTYRGNPSYNSWLSKNYGYFLHQIESENQALWIVPR